jgi:beta-glucanase (GH16 family)
LNRSGLQLFCFLALLVLSDLPVAAQNWTLVWADEFNQADGTAPDPSKWGHDVGGNGWGNNELEYYTDGTTNSWIENGQLVIEARQQSFAGKNYTSARLLSKGKASWTYGRIEARIKIPRGQGLWPAFWTLGTNIASVSWPTCGEIDIMENIGKEPGTVHGTAHGPGYSGGNGIGGPYVLSGGGAFADNFHVFAIEWETNRIQWFVDGQPYFTITPSRLPSGTTWVFNAPQFLLLNVAVGGNWPGNPDGTTTFPQRMVVDYVRVYSSTNGQSCGGNVLTNPGFELSGLANWWTYGSGANTALASQPVHSGTNSFKVYGQFTGSQNDSGLYQDIPTTPGTEYSANAWAFTAASDRIAGNNTAWTEVTFRDTTNILALYRTALVTSNTPASAWMNLPVTNQFNPQTQAFIGSVTNLVAPAGTMFVRNQVLFRQVANASGSVFWDDLSLTTPGPQEIPIAVSPGNSSGSLSIAFLSFLGAPYQVFFKNSLIDANWEVLTNLIGDGGVKVVMDPFTNGQRFYRVARMCE